MYMTKVNEIEHVSLTMQLQAEFITRNQDAYETDKVAWNTARFGDLKAKQQ